MFQIDLKVLTQAKEVKEAATLEVETTKFLDQQVQAWLAAHKYDGATLKRTGIKAFEATLP